MNLDVKINAKAVETSTEIRKVANNVTVRLGIWMGLPVAAPSLLQ